MTKYIAFLRGINVENIRIKMDDLKSAFENMGCKDVKTYLQTGNVVFESSMPIPYLKPTIEKDLSDTFNYKAYVLLYKFDVLSEMIAKYPMERDESHHAYLVFIDKTAVFEELKTLANDVEGESDFIKPGTQIIYWKVPIGESTDTPFSKILARAKYKSSVTVRNINTLEKMI